VGVPQPTSDEKLPFNLVSGVRTRPSASAQGSRPKDFVEFCEIQTDEGATLAMLLSVQSIHKPSGKFKLGCTIAIQVAIRRFPGRSAQTAARTRSLACVATSLPSGSKAWHCWLPSKPSSPVSHSTQTSPEQTRCNLPDHPARSYCSASQLPEGAVGGRLWPRPDAWGTLTSSLVAYGQLGATYQSAMFHRSSDPLGVGQCLKLHSVGFTSEMLAWM
jgi:hypothetical protein